VVFLFNKNITQSEQFQNKNITQSEQFQNKNITQSEQFQKFHTVGTVPKNTTLSEQLQNPMEQNRRKKQIRFP
jgi:hypothetical protein